MSSGSNYYVAASIRLGNGEWEINREYSGEWETIYIIVKPRVGTPPWQKNSIYEKERRSQWVRISFLIFWGLKMSTSYILCSFRVKIGEFPQNC